MNDSAYKISLDINEHGSQAVLKAKQSDTGRKIYISLRAGGTPYTIADDCYAVFTATKPDGAILYDACTIENNEIIYEFTDQTCSAVGRSRCEVKLYGKDDTLITSSRFALLIDGTVYPDGRVESTSEFSALTKLVSETITVQENASEAAGKANEAAECANDAAGASNEAATAANLSALTAISASEAAINAAQTSAAATESANQAAEAATQAAQIAAGATEEAKKATASANQAALDAENAAQNANKAAIKAAQTAKSLMVVGKTEGTVIPLDDAINQFLVGLRVFGKTTQDGTPTPEAPVELVSAGDSGAVAVTICGANLVDINNLTHVSGSNGSYSVRGDIATVSGKANWSRVENKVMPAIPGTTIYLSCKGITGGINPFITSYCVDTTGKLRNFGPGLTAAGKVSYRVPDYAVKIGFRMYSNGTENTLTEPIEASFDSVMMSFVDVPYERYNGQTVSIATPNGLPGIPVSSGGNYTDANGQQWICDEIDFYRGVYVQRLYHTSVPNIGWTSEKTDPAYYEYKTTLSNVKLVNATVLSSHFARVDNNRMVVGGNVFLYARFPVSAGIDTLEKAVNFFTTNTVSFVAVLLEPIETPLSEEKLAAYAALHTYRNNTTVSNDAGAYMELEYVMDAKKYIDSLVTGGASARLSNVTILASAWKTEADGLHSQVVNISGVTKYSKVDLLPSVEQLAIFHNKDVTFVTENEDGVVTVYAIGDKPILDYTMQAQITEVTV